MMFKRLLIGLLAAILAFMAGPLTASADPGPPANSVPVDATSNPSRVYTEAGHFKVKDRLWWTTCEPYSRTTRCQANIWADQVTYSGGKFTKTTGWAFNNLTYLPLPKETWGDNKLANHGTWTDADGRRWETQCNTVETGNNTCRTWVYSSIVQATQLPGGSYSYAVAPDVRVFNNIVQLSSATNNCDVSQLPPGFAVTGGVPHSVKPPYTPIDQFNPVSVALFIDSVSKMTNVSEANRSCLMELGGELALSKAVHRTYGGVESLWFPYPFEFSANPMTPTLQPGWYSGMAQGAMMNSFGLLYDRFGDQKWADAAETVFESFYIPYAEGGFNHHLRINGQQVLMFEEYPTGATPTSVLNGNHIAIISLYNHAKRFGDARAQDLVDEAVAHYDEALKVAELPVEGGIMSTYDLVRGYPAAPLRIVPLGGAVTRSELNGATVPVPQAPRSAPAPNVIVNSGLDSSAGWTIIGTGTTIKDGYATVRPNAKGWTGIEQMIPGGTFKTGEKVNIQLQGRATYPMGREGVSPRYVVYQSCPGKTTNILDRQKNRGDVWAIYRDEFTVLDGSCPLRVQLLTVRPGANDTVIYYDNISVRRSDTQGASLNPKYDIYVWRTPVNTLTLYGSGLVAVEAYWDGRWQSIIQFNALPQGRSVQIPEEMTGRNIHYGYHDTSHIFELQQLYKLTGKEYFKTYADRWLPLAPSNKRYMGGTN